jgi:5-formyltetrahydrofolate cyclo-ligase
VITDIETSKAEARKVAARMRKSAHEQVASTAGLALAGLNFPVEPVPGRSVVSAFFPYKSEIDTRPLAGKLAGEGWTTALPIVIALGQPLVFRRWLPGQPTVPGMWDIPQPMENSPLVEPDVLLVPMLAFDGKGYRLGYGGGFYDRTLEVLRAKKSIVAIGVAFAAQQVDSVVRSAHDQPLDYVMTEKEVFACA